jgi:hypothetical protein
MLATIEKHLAGQAEYLLNYKSPKISKDHFHLPGPDLVDRIFAPTNRNNRALSNLGDGFDFRTQGVSASDEGGRRLLTAVQDIYFCNEISVA